MIFNYHQITPGRDAYLYAISTDLLEEHLAAVTAQQPERPFQITFDDGHLTQLRYGVPVLRKFNQPAIFFCTVGWMGVDPEYFTWDDVREVHRLGYAVGAHGWSHKFLTQCSPQELDKELVSSKKTLEDQLGAPVTTISFPGGRYNKAVLQACADAGYTSLYTSDAWASNTAATVKVYGRMTTTRNMRGEDLVRVLQCGGKPPLATRLTVSAKSTAKKLLGDNLYYRLWSVLARSRRREGMG